MEQKKIITIFGATGAQGGGLARAILADKNSQFSVRAVTRNPDSDHAKDLAGRGASIIVGDIDDPQTVRRALEGAYGTFFVTFFWAHFSPEREYEQARQFAFAAREAKLAHVIWSTLEDTRHWIPLHDDRMPTLQEKYKVPHYDGKGAADHFFEEAGLPVTYFRTSFYWENFIHFGMGPRKGADGKYYLSFPLGNARLPGISAADIGKCAYGIFRNGQELIGKTVAVSGGCLSGQEMAEKMSRALGVEILYNSMTPAAYRALGFPGSDDLGNMFQFKRDFEEYYCGVRNPAEARKLNPQLKSFDEWIAEHASSIPLD